MYEEGQFHESRDIDSSLNSPKKGINLRIVEPKPADSFPKDVIPSDHGYQSGSGRSSITTHSSTG